MTNNEAKLLKKLDELANDTEVDMYSVATLNFFFEECANTIRNLIEELQKLKENQRKCEDCAGCTNWKCDCYNERAQAIDDYTKSLKPVIDEKIKGWTNSDDLRRWCENSIDKVAEQLKSKTEC